MPLRFDLQQLRQRLARAGRPTDMVIGIEAHPWRWRVSAYFLGLTLVGYLYFVLELTWRPFGPLGVIGVMGTFLAPLPLVLAVERRARRPR